MLRILGGDLHLRGCGDLIGAGLILFDECQLTLALC
jgi:hypothetical protein